MEPIISYFFKKFYENKYSPWVPQYLKFYHFRKQLFNGYWIKAKKKILNKRNIQSFIVKKFPAKNVYYSLSKWLNPEKMGRKSNLIKCLGTNLVFDFDIINDIFDINQFESGKEEVLRLKKYLKNNFGFSKFAYLWTGYKGFHLYVLDYDNSEFYFKNIENSNNEIEDINNVEILNREFINKIIQEENFPIDFNVLLDLKRIIRLPNTLHGSTGLQSILLGTENELKNFTIDRSFQLNNSFNLKLFFIKDVPEINFNSISIGPYNKGDIKLVPSDIGCFLILRNTAKLVSRPKEISLNDLEPYVWLENKIRWCKNCNIPIIEMKKCPVCSYPTFLVHLSGVGDVRPAFKINIERIRNIINSQYGTPSGQILIPNNKIILLNRVPRVKSRQMEVIIDGQIIGKVKYNEEILKFIFIPSIEGAKRLYAAGKGNWIKIAPNKNFKIFQFLDKEDIIDSNLTCLQPNDLVFIVRKNHVIGIGKPTSKKFKSDKKFVQILNLQPKFKNNELPGGQSWSQVIKANNKILNKYEEESILFIKKIKDLYKELKVTVPFSGGKDSLVTVALTMKALDDFTVNYVKSEIEFPETNKYVVDCIKKLGLLNKYIQIDEPRDLKTISELLGPPQLDNRWCCKIYKFGPTNKLYRKQFPDGCLSFVGLRSYESNSRTLNYRLNINPWLPNAYSVHPIYDWNALLIWLYIFKNNLPINPIYEHYGRERVGCWICPFQDPSNFHLLREDHENLWKYLKQILKQYIGHYQISDDFIIYGLWRWIEPPQKVKNWAKSKKIALIPLKNIKQNEKKILHINNETKSKNIFKINGMIENFSNINNILNIINIIGKPYINTTENSLNINIKNGNLKIFSDGNFEITADNKDIANELIKNLKSTLLRLQYCIGCLNCLSICDQGAIYQISSELPPLINSNKCIHCLKCNYWCPIVKYSIF